MPALEARKTRGNEARCSGIRHLLVVAAPSGAGKTTFVQQLSSAKLIGEVKARLPLGVEYWMQLKGGEHYRWLAAILHQTKEAEIPGLILDYDMTRKIASQGDFADDPALRVLTLAKAVTVLNLRPPLENLISQVARREIGADVTDNLPRQKLVWRAKHIGRSIVVCVASLFPRSFSIRLQRSPILSQAWSVLNIPRVRNVLAKLRLYEQRGWIEGLYDRWDHYLRSVAEEGVQVEQIFLEPDANTELDGMYLWRLAESQTRLPRATSVDCRR